MRSGRTLWDELCARYDAGVEAVLRLRQTWDDLAPYVDLDRFEHVAELLAIQEKEAVWWRDACLLYFQSVSKRPFPADCQPPRGSLADFIRVHHSHVPGI
jgi:alpha-glucuronidase